MALDLIDDLANDTRIGPYVHMRPSLETPLQTCVTFPAFSASRIRPVVRSAHCTLHPALTSSHRVRFYP